MNVSAQELLDEYLSSEIKSVKAHRRKLLDYYAEFKPSSIKEFFDEENMKLFIFARDTSPKNVRAALSTLHVFAKKRGYISKLEVFPISETETEGLNSEGRKGEIYFIPRNYSLTSFYSDALPLYKDKEKRLIVKAFIALCLGAGYRPVDVQNMTLSDYNREINTVTNPYKTREENNRYSLEIVDNIKLIPPASNCVAEFWDYFWSGKNIEAMKQEKFIYSASHKNPLAQLRIALEQITNVMKFDNKITPTDLRANMILHSLYNSNGASLPDLVRIFGISDITVINALNEYYKNTGMKMIQSYDPTPDDSNEDDESEPERREVMFERVIRDTIMAKSLKQIYDNNCQVCGDSIEISTSIRYSECHHVKPLGKPHNGKDSWDNMLILCPNHHAMFDLGVIAIHPETGQIFTATGYPESEIKNGLLLKDELHELNPKYVKYHWENKFLPNIYPINKEKSFRITSSNNRLNGSGCASDPTCLSP